MSRVSASSDDTQPVKRYNTPASVKARDWLSHRGRWLLTSLILFTTCTLVVTLGLFVSAIPLNFRLDLTNNLTVSIRRGGALRQVETSASTVGDLLAEQGIALPPADALAPSADERLRDGMVVTVLRMRAVTITENGSEREVRTTLENPLAILQEAGIKAGEGDKIWVNGALAHYHALPEWTVPARHIRIRRAVSLAIIDDGDRSTLETTAATVGDALFAAGFSLFLTDEVTPPLNSPVTNALTISIKRALPVVLALDGVDIDARTNAATVADVLSELHAPLYGLDYVKPPGETPVAEDMRIEIVRVTEEVVTETEFINHSTQFRPDSNLNLDASAVVQQGRDGSRENRYRVRYENGIEVSREHIETVEAAPALNRIIAYGTNAVPLGTVNTPAGPRQYWRRLCVYVTSYKPSSNGGNLNTATGEDLRKGVIAAKPNIIAYYSELYVPGYGLGTVYDTGGGPSGTDYWVDLGFSEHDYVNTRKYSYVYLLGAPPAKTPQRLPAWTPNSNWRGNCA